MKDYLIIVLLIAMSILSIGFVIFAPPYFEKAYKERYESKECIDVEVPLRDV